MARAMDEAPSTGRSNRDVDGVDAKLVQKAGAWYSIGEERIGQGKENARQYLKENPELAQQLEATLREKFVPAEAKPGEDDGDDADTDA